MVTGLDNLPAGEADSFVTSTLVQVRGAEHGVFVCVALA